MQLIEVPNCPIDGTQGVVRYSGVRDAFFGTQGRWTYREHQQTGHLWLDPRPADQSIGELYSSYYTHSSEGAPEIPTVWQQSMAIVQSTRLGYPAPENPHWLSKLVTILPSVGDAAELEVMRIPASETGRLLDVGCGGGKFLRRMNKAGWDVVGTEPDAKAAARLAEQEGFPVYRALEDLIDEEVQKFDVIVLSHVIEHLPDPIHTLSQLRGLLSSGGRLLLTTPNILSLGTRIFGESWRGLEPPRHFNVFSPSSLRQSLERTGFYVQRMNTDVRLARGIWFQSYLARAGGCELENIRGTARNFLKFTGYVFQLFEAGVVKIRPSLGEEIYCVALTVGDAQQVP